MMNVELRELDTIQTKAKLNKVYSRDKTGAGRAHHDYIIEQSLKSGKAYTYLRFQEGPRNEPDSISGILDCDLLEIVRDRFKAFQEGPYSSEYTARALQHIEEALYQMNLRVEDRLSRGIMGKLEK